MKTGQVKWILCFLLAFFLLNISQAQDSTEVSKDSIFEGKDPIVSSLPQIRIDSIQSPEVKVDSNKLVKEIGKKGTNNKYSEPISSIKKDAVADTLVLKTASGSEEGGIDDNKIQELTNLVSSGNIFYTIVFLLFGFVFIRILTYILNALAERSTKYRIAFKGSIPIVKIVGWMIVLILIIVVIYKPSVASMLAVSASIGVAIGFASQDILKNIFGGIVILLDRPFVSGDKIEVDKYYGEVVEIGLRSTRIVTPDDSLVSVPNAVMMNSSLSNSNAGEPNCQVVAEIYLPLTVDTIKTREIATQAATVSKYIYLGKSITVLFLNEVNNTNSFYKMRVKAYVMDIRDEFRFKSDMTELIITELVKEGILDGKF
ncbi:mechanosensitive ion channel domain-containing protein [uncultured Marivirga sp.]|uniref:mechanosensitive ion channel family protein n=1 Tax=uncultured Marivirga sp. TaxID=1123707 RepID=UPI0030ED3FC8|tara:strand:+ start:86408 stop:87523 length:1116 start_codon:yes stop_codon:yes gene_type:complete